MPPGSAVVIYFYPRDNTPGCTQEGRGLCRGPCAVQEGQGADRRHLRRQHGGTREIQAEDGVSIRTAQRSRQKICTLYDVIQEKSMYGKKFLGIERSTFLIDPKGVLRHIWRKVKVNGHAAAVLAAVKAL